jgi:DUF4097 and DUF4098 domain-containing protein YvlB
MNKNHHYLKIVILFVLAGSLAFGQEPPVEKATVPFSNPAKPGLVEATVQNGSIIVKGYEGKEVIIEARPRGTMLTGEAKKEREEALREKRYEVREAEREAREEEKKASDKAKGMKLIQPTTAGLTVEEENNVMEVSVESWKRSVDLTLQVPYSTSLNLHTFNNGEIVIEKVSGEIEVNNHNGPLRLTNVSGAVVANTFNGDVNVILTSVAPDKPMSFSTFNGDVDVTFPASIKANVKMKSDRGDIYSDFEVSITPSPAKVIEDEKKEEGKYRISFGKYIYGTINGGGPEFQFNNFNGDIYIRKAK